MFNQSRVKLCTDFGARNPWATLLSKWNLSVKVPSMDRIYAQNAAFSRQKLLMTKNLGLFHAYRTIVRRSYSLKFIQSIDNSHTFGLL